MAHIELIQTVAALVLGLVQVYIDPEEVVQALQSRKRRSSCAKSRERLQQHRAPSSSGSSRAKGTKRRGAATSRGLRSATAPIGDDEDDTAAAAGSDEEVLSGSREESEGGGWDCEEEVGRQRAVRAEKPLGARAAIAARWSVVGPRVQSGTMQSVDEWRNQSPQVYDKLMEVTHADIITVKGCEKWTTKDTVRAVAE